MTRSTATFAATLFAAATSFAAAGMLTPAPASAQSVTVTVYGPSGGSPDSVVSELSGPGAAGVTVTVTELGSGMTPLPTTGTTDGNGTVTVNLPPGVYEVTVEGDGHTGVDYITVGADGETETADFSLDGLPSTDTANGGTDAIDDLAEAASNASESGDAGALAEAEGDLNASANQSESAVEALEEIADDIMEDLPDRIRDGLEEDLAEAETAEEVQAAIDRAEERIAEDMAGAREFAEAFGQEYEITLETLRVLDALHRLENILRKLKQHQLQLQAAQDALSEIASAAANNSQASANAQHRLNVQGNLLRSLAAAGRYVPRPSIQRVHRPTYVYRAPVERPRRVIVLTAGPSRR